MNPDDDKGQLVPMARYNGPTDAQGNPPPPDLGDGPIVPRYDRGYGGAGTEPFSDEAQAILLAPVDPREVEIRPDGIVYLPWIHWAGRLNRAFGVGGWTIVPRDRPQRQGPIVLYNGALYILGRFVREAYGECKYQEGNAGMSYGDALEGAQSDCLVRCAKYLGIGREMWDANWREPFLAGACLKAWLADKRQWLYWRADRAEPWQVTKANARPQPASDLDQDDPRVVAIKARMRGELNVDAVGALLRAEEQVVNGKAPPADEPYPHDIAQEPTPEEIGSLFDAPPPKPPRTRRKPVDPPPEPGRISAAQHRALEASIAEFATLMGLNPDATRARMKDYVGREFGVEHFPDLSPAQFEKLMTEVLVKRPKNGRSQ